jgi:catechol 2,3-dioxygenase-like lactoylglutathione lyase family enzyme
MLHIDHVALPCFDREATEAFYAGGLGLAVAACWSDASPLWQGRRFTYLAFALARGELLDFLAIEGLARAEPDDAPIGARHVALGVDSRAELDAVRARLAARGVWVSEPVDHGGGRVSVYCFDPNGHQLELTHRPEAA